jgi:diacylglycerol kinase
MGNEGVNSALEKAIDHIAEQIKIYRATPFDAGIAL